VTHPLTAGVGFTGSLKGGRALFDLGSKRENPIPVFAEMGSVNPVFLLPGKVSAGPEQIAGKLVDSMTNTAGQFCTKPGLFIILENEASHHLISMMEDSILNVPAATMLNENIANNFHKGVADVKIESDVTVMEERSSNQTMIAFPVLATVNAEIFLSRPQLHHEVLDLLAWW
jgi:NADP-dependent aldehyde dehydrogenase